MPIITTPDSYTKLLIHSNGPADSGTFLDSSASKHTISTSGDPKNTDTKPKFQSTAIYLDGNDNLNIAHSSDFDFGTGDFTIDFWVNHNDLSGSYRGMINHRQGGDGWEIKTNSAAKVTWFNSSDGTERIASTALSTGQWYHIAVVNNGGAHTMYIDGVSAVTWSHSDNGSHSKTLYIGEENNVGSFELLGYMDEIRISKGIARWTDSFVPPNKPYSVIDDDFVTDVSGSQGGARDSSTKISSDLIILSDPDEASTDNVFSVSDKNANNLMSIRADGIITKPYLPAFHAYINGVTEDSTHGTITFNATSYNIGNHYDTSTYKFTAPVDGIYSFTLNVGLDGIQDSNSYFGFNFIVGGVHNQWQFIWENSKAQDYWSKCTTREFQMDASDTCYVSLSGSGTGQFSGMRTGAHDSTFSGHLIG